MSGTRIPRFESREAEARFWSETSLDELAPDQLTKTTVALGDRPQVTFAVRLDDRTIELLRRIARVNGLGAALQVRRWIIERLQLERSVGALVEPSGHLPGELERSIRQQVLSIFLDRLPDVVDVAMRDVLDRADHEAAAQQWDPAQQPKPRGNTPDDPRSRPSGSK
jgi:hypothetical protein